MNGCLQESDEAAVADDGDASDTDSDGYGEEGLSWEAVMENLQVQKGTDNTVQSFHSQAAVYASL